jgi:benzoyl-CoA reductase/2-hydroxyglutaryl-CoA dehydratase subunit BcrC/BadD/HgdB
MQPPRNQKLTAADTGHCSAIRPSAQGTCKTSCPLNYFKGMIDNCLAFARTAKEQGRPIVGIMCEFTPRELILAAGGVPVCLCGGSAATATLAERDLPAGLCPLIKSTYGYHVQRSNPFLEMADLIVAETTCDGKKKMFELMGRTRRMHVLELPQKPDDPDAKEHWLAELRKLRDILEQQFSTRITDAKLRAAIDVMNRERRLRRQLAQRMMADPPPMTGRQLLDLKSIISAIPADLDQYEQMLQRLDGGRVAQSLSGRPRVLLTGVPLVHGAQRVLELIEEQGGIVVAMENCTGLKPVMEEIAVGGGDPLAALAETYFHLPCSVMTPNSRRLELLRRLIADYRPQCVIELVWQGCLTYDVESALVRQMVQEELHLGYLKIQTDYSPSDSARLGTRIQALLETLPPHPPLAGEPERG